MSPRRPPGAPHPVAVSFPGAEQSSSLGQTGTGLPCSGGQEALKDVPGSPVAWRGRLPKILPVTPSGAVLGTPRPDTARCYQHPAEV